MRRPSFCLDVRFGLLELISQLGKGEIAGVFLLTCNFTDAYFRFTALLLLPQGRKPLIDTT